MAYLYETHMHTSESSICGRNSAIAQVRAYKDRGYTGIIITDHYLHSWWKHVPLPWKWKVRHMAAGYTAAKKEGQRLGLDVFFGWEFTDKGSDFLTYGLDVQFLLDNPYLNGLSIEDYSGIVRGAGGYLAQAHPYRDKPWIERKGPVDPGLVDGIEVYNGLNLNSANEKAMAFAKAHNLPMQAGSDAHGINIKFSSGVKLKRRAKSIFDIIFAIKNREAQLILPTD